MNKYHLISERIVGKCKEQENKKQGIRYLLKMKNIDMMLSEESVKLILNVN